MITVILFGKCLEAYSKKQTVEKMADLASLKPTRACLVREFTAGKLVSDAELSKRGRDIDPDLLHIDDIVRVSHGQTVPIDGTVIKGSGLVNESMLTGESKPIVKEEDAKVFAGTLLQRGDLLVRVDKPADSAAINQIMRLVENAQATKAPIQRVADVVASYFVPIIVILAVLTWAFWFTAVYTDFLGLKLAPT